MNISFLQTRFLIIIFIIIKKKIRFDLNTILPFFLFGINLKFFFKKILKKLLSL